MVKISLDDYNLSKMHAFPKIDTDRISERISAHVADESIKFLLSEHLPILRTNTEQANNEMIAGGA